MSAASVAAVCHLVNATKERQAWCYLQVKLCDPCLSALSVHPWPKKVLYKYSSFPFLSLFHSREPDFCTGHDSGQPYSQFLPTDHQLSSRAVAEIATTREVIKYREMAAQYIFQSIILESLGSMDNGQ